MNKAILVGWITDIREVGSYGVMVKLKTCEKGFTTQKGYKVADRIDYHVCLAKGTIEQYKEYVNAVKYWQSIKKYDGKIKKGSMQRVCRPTHKKTTTST